MTTAESSFTATTKKRPRRISSFSVPVIFRCLRIQLRQLVCHFAVYRSQFTSHLSGEEIEWQLPRGTPWRVKVWRSAWITDFLTKYATKLWVVLLKAVFPAKS